MPKADYFRGSGWVDHPSGNKVLIENDPSARPQTEFLCKPIGRIMEEKSMTRNHGGEVIGRAIIEKESLRREASDRHLGGIWEAAGGSWRLGAPGGSKTPKSMPLSAKIQNVY